MDAKPLASDFSIMTLVNLSDSLGPERESASAGAKDNTGSSILTTSRPSDMADYSMTPFQTSRSEVQAPIQGAPLVRASTRKLPCPECAETNDHA